jgi:hypothetical protein
MINLDANWKNIKGDDGSFKTLPAGVYKCVVKQAAVKQSKKGKEMLVICFDIADNSEYNGYFMDLYAKRHEEAVAKGEQAKYPNNGCYYQLTQGEFLPRFKYIIDCIEESNGGYIFTGDEKSLVGKVFGAVMREEEYESQRDGSIKTTVKCDRIVPVSKIETTKVPECKKLKNVSTANGSSPMESVEIPF